MDAITLQRIEQAHPKIREQLLQDYKDANNLLGKGCRLRFSYVYRSPKQQHEIFLQRPRVTKADAWQSIHNYGLAFDIVLLYDKDGNGSFEAVSWDMKYDGDKDGISDWLEITKLFTSRGYTNGFISNGKRWDFPHFQKDFGYNWRSLKNLIDNGDVINDANGIVYPKF